MDAAADEAMTTTGGSRARADQRTNAIVDALGRGLSLREAASVAGVSVRTVVARLEDPDVLARVTASRPPCGVCRGRGVCTCVRCPSRGYEYLDRATMQVVYPTRDELPCHHCGGSGRSPIRSEEDIRRLRGSPGFRRVREDVIDAWVAEHGLVCPGFGRVAHPVERADLTVDHARSLVRGGHVSSRDNLGVLCRSCNSRKGAGGKGGTILTAEQAEGAARVGAALRRAREAKGMSLEDLRATTRRSVIYLQGVEDGALLLSQSDLRQNWWWVWSDALGISTESLLREHERDLGIDHLGDRKRRLLERVGEWAVPPPRKPKRRHEAAFAALETRARAAAAAVEDASDHGTLDLLVAEVRAIVREGTELSVLDRTGRPLDAWADIVEREGPADALRRDDYLYRHHRLSAADRERVLNRIRRREREREVAQPKRN